MDQSRCKCWLYKVLLGGSTFSICMHSSVICQLRFGQCRVSFITSHISSTGCKIALSVFLWFTAEFLNMKRIVGQGCRSKIKAKFNLTFYFLLDRTQKSPHLTIQMQGKTLRFCTANIKGGNRFKTGIFPLHWKEYIFADHITNTVYKHG